jgi:hypothetical protein
MRSWKNKKIPFVAVAVFVCGAIVSSTIFFWPAPLRAQVGCPTCPSGWAPAEVELGDGTEVDGCQERGGSGVMACPAPDPTTPDPTCYCPSGSFPINGGTACGTRNPDNSVRETDICHPTQAAADGRPPVEPIGGNSKAKPSAFSCNPFDGGDFLPNCSASILNLILSFAGLFLGLAGLFLDSVINATIVGFSKFVQVGAAEQGAITLAWSLVRDVLNMTFIFILLYLGIKTILGDSSYQKVIPKIVIAGLLINFSFFFTEVLIDLSNVLTVQFYDAIMRIGAVADASSSVPVTLKGLSAAFMNGLKLKPPSDPSSTLNMIFSLIPAILTFLIAAFVFLVMGVMLLVRFIVLIILLITSPISVMGDILPQLTKQSKQWWSTLSEQLIFAPAFMLFMLIVVLIINSAGFQNGINVVSTGQKTTVVNDMLQFLLPYALAIGLMIAGLVISKQLAGSAGKGFTEWASKKAGTAAFGTSAWLGRKTIGRTGGAIADSGYLNAAAARNAGPFGLGGLAARGLIGSGKWTGNASFDVRGVDAIGKTAGAGKAAEGFIKHREAEKKQYKDYMKKATAAPMKESERRAAAEAAVAEARQRQQDAVNESQLKLQEAESEFEEAKQDRDRGRIDGKQYEAAQNKYRAAQKQHRTTQEQHERRVGEAVASVMQVSSTLTDTEARKRFAKAGQAMSSGEMAMLRGIVESVNKDKNLNDDQKKQAIRRRIAALNNQRVTEYQNALAAFNATRERNEQAQKAAQEKISAEMADYATSPLKFWRAAGGQDAADEMRKELSKGKEKKFIEEAQKLFKEAGLAEEGGGGGEAKPREGGGESTGGGGETTPKAA